jgi:hypothetical protein
LASVAEIGAVVKLYDETENRDAAWQGVLKADLKQLSKYQQYLSFP